MADTIRLRADGTNDTVHWTMRDPDYSPLLNYSAKRIESLAVRLSYFVLLTKVRISLYPWYTELF